MAVKRKGLRVPITMKIKPEVLELARQGAAYHDIRYQTYLQWLIEEGLKAEADYYGWDVPAKIGQRKKPSLTQRREIQRLVRNVIRKRK